MSNSSATSASLSESAAAAAAISQSAPVQPATARPTAPAVPLAVVVKNSSGAKLAVKVAAAPKPLANKLVPAKNASKAAVAPKAEAKGTATQAPLVKKSAVTTTVVQKSKAAPAPKPLAAKKVAPTRVSGAAAAAPKSLVAKGPAQANVVSKALATKLKPAPGKAVVSLQSQAEPKPVSIGVSAKPAATPKSKLVRDSFTMPQNDFALIAMLKDRSLGFKRATKKSELLRAGLHALAGLNANALRLALDSLAPLKSGRPKNMSK